ncbi:MAG TPA: cytochrome c [Oceanospirillales bacterium]|nr:cytochrome c [Oceanospirillales bacterium]
MVLPMINGRFYKPVATKAMKAISQLLLLTGLSLMIACCKNNDNSIQKGKALFQQVHIGKSNVVGCISCHSTDGQATTVGPSLAGLGLRADKLLANTSAQAYIKQSIINPDAYIVSGYAPAVMYAHYQTELSPEEIDALVSYLLSLK